MRSSAPRQNIGYTISPFWRTFTPQSGLWSLTRRVRQPQSGSGGRRRADRSEDDHRLPRCESIGRKACGAGGRLRPALGRASGRRLRRSTRARSPHPSMAYARSEKAIAGVMAHERRIDEACECATAEVGEHFSPLCASWASPRSSGRFTRDKTAEAAIINSLHSDLLVVGPPGAQRPAGRHVGREDPACQRRSLC